MISQVGLFDEGVYMARDASDRWIVWDLTVINTPG